MRMLGEHGLLRGRWGDGKVYGAAQRGCALLAAIMETVSSPIGVAAAGCMIRCQGTPEGMTEDRQEGKQVLQGAVVPAVVRQ